MRLFAYTIQRARFAHMHPSAARRSALHPRRTFTRLLHYYGAGAQASFLRAHISICFFSLLEYIYIGIMRRDYVAAARQNCFSRIPSSFDIHRVRTSTRGDVCVCVCVCACVCGCVCVTLFATIPPPRYHTSSNSSYM